MNVVCGWFRVEMACSRADWAGTGSGYKFVWLLKLVSSQFNSVRNVNALHAILSILRYYLPHKYSPALKITNLTKGTWTVERLQCYRRVPLSSDLT